MTVPRPILWLLAVALLIGGVFAVEFGGGQRSQFVRDAEVPTLERQGDALRAALERHRRRNNGYPSTLAETGVGDTALATRFGPWRYARAGESGASSPECGGPYSLSVGDYDRNHFEVCWSWSERAWRWNR